LCRPLTNRPPVPDGTTLHYAVASTEAKLVFSDREATDLEVWIFWNLRDNFRGY